MTQASARRGVLTLAFGKPKYLEQAKTLGRSLRLHARDTASAVVTDSADRELRSLFSYVLPYRPEIGANVRQKIHLDHYTPFEETLFVDSDCIVLSNLDSFWVAFAGQAFGVPGFRTLSRGATDRYLDVTFILDTFHLEELPKFNGGAYYFTRSPETARLFTTARYLLANYEALRFGNFRGDAADEAIFSVAMAMHGIRSTFMGDRGMWTPTDYTGPFRLDAIKGRCSFTKDGQALAPEIVHFCGEYANLFAYPREAARLKKISAGCDIALAPLGRDFIKSVLWQTIRRLPALSNPVRRSIRLYRNLRKSLPSAPATGRSPHEG